MEKISGKGVIQIQLFVWIFIIKKTHVRYHILASYILHLGYLTKPV